MTDVTQRLVAISCRVGEYLLAFHVELGDGLGAGERRGLANGFEVLARAVVVDGREYRLEHEALHCLDDCRQLSIRLGFVRGEGALG